MAAKLTNSLACIPDGCDIIRSHQHEEFDELILSRSFPKERVCPVCGSTHCIIKSSNVTQSVRHIAISRRPLILTFQKRRLQCKSCGISFYEDPDWIIPGLRMTVQLAYVLYLALMDMISLHLIALNNGITLSVLIKMEP